MSTKDNGDNIIKVDKWDGAAVKNALDDVVKNILIKKYNYIENFTLLDGRLALSAIAVLVAGVALAWDYFYPFPASKPVLLICVSIYFVLSVIITFYTSYMEKGIFVVAIQRDPSGYDPDIVWEASSYMKKYDDKYSLILSMKNSSTGVSNEASATKSVANFIDVNGVVIPELVEAVVSNLHDSLSSERKDK
ncbi:probable signal peptidase complex subunit 2 [Copidosoma floridanum]|uniref:probable signal peptidase complex subunit 2 n=1 Tax=Copidosoma floridanum TaxID=29053 RepID=UPI0006C9E042|nr:probable signal peptidase complex subunit 2 [Copidosoma floridanum]